MPHAQPTYQAVAHIVGRYHPSPTDRYRGELVAEDGGRYPAKLSGWALNALWKQFPEMSTNELLEQTWIWKVYPRTLPHLVFSLVKAWQVPEDYPNIEVFKISGEVEWLWFEEEEMVDILIQRSDPNNNCLGSFDPLRFRLRLYGSVPARALGKIWRFEAQRQGDRLVILSAMEAPVPDSTEPQASVSEAEQSEPVIQTIVSPVEPELPAAPQQEDLPQAAPSTIPEAVVANPTKQPAKGKPQPEPEQPEVPVAPTSTKARKTAAQPKSTPKESAAIAKAGQSNPAKSAEGKRQILFKVTANHRQFPGAESVSLKNRVLVIDGKVAAQTLVAIVEGTPKRMEADGTKQVGNQTILTSR